MLKLIPSWLVPAPDSLAGRARRRGENPWRLAWSLLWSVWVLSSAFYGAAGPAFWWSVALSYPLFILLFGLLIVRPYGETDVYTVGLALLGYVAMAWNPGCWTYVVFACAMVYYRDSWKHSAVRILLLQALLVLESWWLGWPWFVPALMLSICSSTGFGAMAGHISREKNAELRMSNDEVRRLAAMAERERIGRDLHDLLGHTLSLITLKLELSRKLFDRDLEAARREVAEAENVARHALSEVRAAVTGIRAADLVAELASARLLLESSGVLLDSVAPPMLSLSPEIECGLSLILREAVTNIARHAHASWTQVEMVCENGGVRMVVRDNGRGGISMDGNGLSGMRERVRAMSGSLTIESPRSHGSVVTVCVPLPVPMKVPSGASDAGMSPVPATVNRSAA